MLRQSFEDLYLKFVAALDSVVVTGLNPMKVLSLYLALIREYIGLLREKALTVKFSLEDEIWFFKYFKPRFIAEQVFRMEIYTIDMEKPVGTPEVLRAYFEDELLAVQRFLRKQNNLYHYFRAQLTALDHLYFVRGADVSDLLLPEPPENDAPFSTALDGVFARFIAFERLQQYLLEKIMNPVSLPIAFDLQQRRKKSREMRWTGDSINLVELGFSWYDTGQLNDGKASIAEIFEWMEENLNVVIGKPHRRFDEIYGRKRISKTDYIDRMKDAIMGRIDRKDSFDPDKEEARRKRADRKRLLAEKKAAEQKAREDQDKKDKT
jgi:hypothetical protein